jgi:hypothetical protein
MEAPVKIFSRLFLVTLVVTILALTVVLPAFAQSTQPPTPPVTTTAPVTLPDPLVLLIAAGVGFLVTNGLKALLPKADIAGTAAQITAAVVTGLVAFINQLLALIPSAYQEPTAIGLTLLISIVGAFGIHYTLKNNQVPAIPASVNTGAK